MMWFGVVAAGLLVIALDRSLLAAEARGLIFYRRRKASTGSVSSAVFAPVLDVIAPQRSIIVEERQHQELMREDAGIAQDE